MIDTLDENKVNTFINIDYNKNYIETTSFSQMNHDQTFPIYRFHHKHIILFFANEFKIIQTFYKMTQGLIATGINI